MKTFVLSVLCLLLPVAGRPLLAQQTNQGRMPPDAIATGGPIAAQVASDVWLGLADDAQYAQCWQTAAGIFQRAVPQEKWTTVANTRRTPLGKVISRKLRSATFTTSLPNAPSGKYVTAVYDTSFEKKKTAVETVTVALDPDGLWKVSGYFVH